MATLDRVCAQIGFPKAVRIDQGSGFVFRDLDLRVHQREVVRHFSRRGEPTDDAVTEAFDGRLRSGCPNALRFLALAPP